MEWWVLATIVLALTGIIVLEKYLIGMDRERKARFFADTMTVLIPFMLFVLVAVFLLNLTAF